MKKKTILALLLVLALLLTSCSLLNRVGRIVNKILTMDPPLETDSETGETEPPPVDSYLDPYESEPESVVPETRPSDSAQTEPDGEPDPVDETMLAAFYRTHRGLWTARNGLFAEITEKDGHYYIFFAVWNAGGPFPSAEITSVEWVDYADSEETDVTIPLTAFPRFRLHLVVSAVEPDEESGVDGWESYETDLLFDDFPCHLSLSDGTPDAVAFTHLLSDCSDVFYPHEERQYPDFFETRPLSVAEFVEHYSGYWTAESGSVIFFEKSPYDGDYYAMFFMWNAGGLFPSGKVTAVRELDDGRYELHVAVSAREGDEILGEGWEAYEINFVIGDAYIPERAITCTHPLDDQPDTYYFHKNAGYPYEFFEKGTKPSDFVREFAGTWTDNDKSDFIYFFDENGESKMLFGVWYSGGEFPVARILTVTELEEDHFALLLRFMNGQEEEWEVLNTNSGYLRIGQMGRDPVNYFYDGRFQYPDPPEI